MVDKSKYDGLAMSPQARELLDADPKRWDSLCNGVGSQVGTWWQRMLYHITPDTIWGMNITPASDIHDVEYTIPDYFCTKFVAENYRHESDLRFKHNIETLADRGWRIFRRQRYIRARAYYHILRQQGAASFYAGKTLGG